MTYGTMVLMNVLQAIIIGIVEGITEFLPVSSTFHQIFTAKILGIPQTDFVKLFEVFIQCGAIISVILLFWNTIEKDRELVKKTLVAFIPTAIIGFLLNKIIQNVFFNSTNLLLGAFVVVGLIFLGVELYLSKDKNFLRRSLSSFTYTEAALIGLIQACAVLPGVSRAGAVLLGMMFMRFKRDEAARFSFLLAIPTLFAASFFDLFKLRKEVMSNIDHIGLLLVGTVVAFVSAYIVVKWFIRYLQTHTLSMFGAYRLVVGAVLFFFFR